MTAVTVKEEVKRKKDREKLEKEAEFRTKYTRAFPKFKFYLDLDNVDEVEQEELKQRIVQMGAVCGEIL